MAVLSLLSILLLVGMNSSAQSARLGGENSNALFRFDEINHLGADRAVDVHRQNRQFWTETVTTKSLITMTERITVIAVCAKLINVTGTCRRHNRNFASEEPIILSFNEEPDSIFDVLYATPVQSIEETQLPGPLNHGPSGFSDVVSSRDSADEFEQGRVLRPQSKIYFDLLAELFSLFFRRPPRPVATTTVTITETHVVSQTTTTTNTFFIQKCTPSPFPFELCAHRHHDPHHHHHH